MNGSSELLSLLSLWMISDLFFLPVAMASASYYYDSYDYHNNYDTRQLDDEAIRRGAVFRLGSFSRRRRGAVEKPPHNCVQLTAAADTATRAPPVTAEALTQPFIPRNVWNQLTGEEFVQHPEWLDELSITSQQLAAKDQQHDWVDWTLIQDGDIQNEQDVMVWTGKIKRTRGGEFQGDRLPMIKTRSIVPLTPVELVDLLLDSQRVRTYNPWSLGRKDLWVYNERTKIVQNQTQPPLPGAKPIRATTLLHARPLRNTLTIKAPQIYPKINPDNANNNNDDNSDTTWLVISRAVGGTVFDQEDPNIGRSHILLGVNLLEPYGTDSSIVTAVTHVESTAVPVQLAERLGVQSAKQFVKDLRKVAVPAN